MAVANFPSFMAVEALFPMVIVPVEVPVFMLVSKFDDAFIDVVAPEMVAPKLPIRSPADVIVPVEVVAMLPVVEIAMLVAKSPPAIVPSKMFVEVTQPVHEIVPDTVGEAIVGEVPKTAAPLPVSSERIDARDAEAAEPAVVDKLLLASVAIKLEAESPWILTLPAAT